MIARDREELAAEGWRISDGDIPEAVASGGGLRSYRDFPVRVEVINSRGEWWPAQWSHSVHWGDVLAWRAA